MNAGNSFGLAASAPPKVSVRPPPLYNVCPYTNGGFGFLARELTMLIVYGVYHFRPRRVGFRNDYCLGCDKPRRSFAVRTFDVGHIFWIPFLPLGFWKHWKCSECGRDPHVHVKTRRTFKWLGFACLILLSSIFWSPLEANNEVLWVLRIVPLAGATALLIHLLKTPKDPSLKDRLAAIPPATDVTCPFCATPLVASSAGPWTCPACHSVMY